VRRDAAPSFLAMGNGGKPPQKHSEIKTTGLMGSWQLATVTLLAQCKCIESQARCEQIQQATDLRDYQTLQRQTRKP